MQLAKELYESAELDVIRFRSQDVITTSGQGGLEDPDEGPFVPATRPNAG